MKCHLGVESKSLVKFSCAASTKLVITPCSEVEKLLCLLHVKVDFQKLPTMYIMHTYLSEVGPHIKEKLQHVNNHLSHVILLCWSSN